MSTSRKKYRVRPLRERFEEKFVKVANSECWNWAASVNLGGYGQFSVGGRSGRPHHAPRVSYTLYVGAIPDGLCVCHTCDNRRCVNPNHLFTGTIADNNRDMAIKGRSRGGAINPARGFSLPHTKLSEKQVLEIRTASGLQRDIAERYGIDQSHVSRIKSLENRTRAGEFQ